MLRVNYPKICSRLLKSLGEREREIISRRFGLGGFPRESLGIVGKRFSVCRERVRQIQNAIMKELKEKARKEKEVFRFFERYLKKHGEIKREDILLKELGGEKFQNDVRWLLYLNDKFSYHKKNEKLFSNWSLGEKPFEIASEVVGSAYNLLQKKGELLSFSQLAKELSLKRDFLLSCLELSKEIERTEEGLFGLSYWPEVHPRGVRDKAYLALKKTKKPLHFNQIASLIPGASVETVHNELIKDQRFVLVGRGIYALSEWGYWPGRVKDIIERILRNSGTALSREEILKEVAKQRIVKTSTVLLNLSDKRKFLRDSQGKYRIREV